VLERLAALLRTSLASLLGTEVEYHERAASYFMRMRQLEERAERVVAHFNPFSYLLTSDSYSHYMRLMLEESVPTALGARQRALRDAHLVWKVLEERKRAVRHRRRAIINLVGISEIERLLDTGLVGRLDLPARVRAQRCAAARLEVEHLAAIVENEPFGIQIGLIDEPMPNVTFQLFHSDDQTRLAVSPFRLGELPNVRIGVATVTASVEAVQLYEELFRRLWTRAMRGKLASRLLLALARQRRSHSFG
jgi:hypothetical protein